MSLENNSFYDFANFRVDLSERVLTRDGKPLPITPKAFHLLKILVENHGHVVDKERLMSEIWSDSFVEEGNLAFNARVLRKTLGDSASHPKFIETIPRRGYRFVAEVRHGATNLSLLSSQRARVATYDSPASTAQRKRSRFWITVVCVAIVAALLLVGWYLMSPIFGADPAPILTTQFKSEKLTTSGNVGTAAISPNGEYAAYVDAVGRKQSIWLRRLKTEENIQIVPPAEDHYSRITFSHDGNSLFFTRRPYEANGALGVYRVSAFGGIPQRIVEGVTGHIGISSDDKRLSFVRCNYRPDDFCTLFVADINGMNESRLVTRQAPLLIEDNKFSPDGGSIAFTSGNTVNGGSDQRLYRVDVNSGTEREIAARTFFDVKSIDWLPGGEGLIFSAKEFLDGKVSLWMLRLADGQTTRLLDDPNNYFAVSLNDRADKLISTQVTNTYRLISSTEKGERTLAAARDFAFAPNGMIVYASDDRNIWAIHLDGAAQRQLTNDPATEFSPVVAPDNEFIFFTSNRTGTNQIWRMEMDGSNQTQITMNEGGYPRLVSSDGRWVFYLSGKTGRLWKVSTESGEEVQLSDRKFFAPQISPDGQLIAHFIRDNGLKIGITQVDDQKEMKTIDYVDGNSGSFVVSWLPDSKTLYFVAKKEEKNVLWRQSIDEADRKLVEELGTDDIEKLSLAPDGKSFAFTRGKWIYDAVLISGLK